MLSDTIEYPLEGDDAVTTLLVGGGLYLLAMLLVFPGLFVGGYSVAVCRNVLDGNPEPPAFDDWGTLAVDGLYVAAISLLYWLPGLVVGGVAFLALTLLAVGIGSSSVVAGSLFLFVLFGSALLFAYALAVGYLLPAAIVNYARTDRLSAAWEVGALREVVTDGGYAKGWAVGSLVLLGVNSAGNLLVWILVGFPVLFYGQVAAMHAFTRGTMSALDIAPPSPDHAAEATGAGGGATAPTPGDGPGGSTGADRPGRSTGDDGDAGPAAYVDAGGAATETRDLADVEGVDAATARSLRAAGYGDVAELRAADRADLVAVEGVGPARADRIKSALDDG